MRTQWWSAILLLAGYIQYQILVPIEGGRWIGIDAVIFHYGGNLLVEGYPPYLYLWDIKPPLIYDLTALITLAVPGEPWVQFYLGSALTAAASLAVFAGACALVYRLTERNSAAVSTGLMLIGFWQLLQHPVVGVTPKLFALAFGVGAIHASLRSRHYIAAVLGSVAAGFWPFAVVFTVIVFVRAYREFPGRRDLIARMAGLLLLVAVIGIAPIVLLGGGRAMVYQVLISPILMDDQASGLIARAGKAIGFMPVLWPLFVAGIACAINYILAERRHYWLAGGLIVSLIQVGFLDFDYYPDLFMLAIFCAVGVGVGVGHLQNTTRVQTRHIVIIFACIGLLAAGNIYGDWSDAQAPHPNTAKKNLEKIEGFLNQQIPPESCYISRGGYDHWKDDRPAMAAQQRCEPPRWVPGG